MKKLLFIIGVCLSSAAWCADVKPLPSRSQTVTVSDQSAPLLADLYRKKGELVTTLEISQAQLQEVNKAIVETLNQKK